MICEILDIYWESRCQAETAEFHYQPKNAPFIAKMAKFSTEKPSYEAENSLRRGLSMVGQLLNGVVKPEKALLRHQPKNVLRMASSVESPFRPACKLPGNWKEL
jgi:hypothetical protein